MLNCLKLFNIVILSKSLGLEITPSKELRRYVRAVGDSTGRIGDATDAFNALLEGRFKLQAILHEAQIDSKTLSDALAAIDDAEAKAAKLGQDAEQSKVNEWMISALTSKSISLNSTVSI